MRIGPLSLNPMITITNLGVDQNVFNEATDQNPKKDFTATVTPTADLWLRVGRTWLSGSIKEDIIWYQKYVTERAANVGYTLGWRLPVNRLSLNASTSYLNAHDRPGFEIDVRSRRTEIGYTGSVEVRALPKTYFSVRAERQTEDFDQAAVFLDSNLRVELNRVSTAAAVSVRHQVTPLTSITLDARRSRDRFEFSPLRDSNSTTISSTISFDPFALIKGSATFGYRDFEPLSSGLASYRGSVAAVNLSYTLLGATQFGVTATRDVQYSYDVNQPYYLQTGFNGSIAQHLFGPLDVVGRFGAQTLSYRDRAGATVQIPDRVDEVRTYGGGIGYRMGKGLRLGFDVDRPRRTSALSQREYDNLKIGTSVTYGL